ncbi:MAG: hypothetical protein ACI4XW_05760, partial [Candidatus Spyradocola sp.]
MGWFVYDEELEQVDLEGEEIEFRPKYGHQTPVQAAGCDLELVRAGIATLTPVSWDCTSLRDVQIAQLAANKMKDAGIALA